jgi:hypothetical protein
MDIHIISIVRAPKPWRGFKILVGQSEGTSLLRLTKVLNIIILLLPVLELVLVIQSLLVLILSISFC